MTTRAWNANAAKYRHMVYLTKELNTQWGTDTDVGCTDDCLEPALIQDEADTRLSHGRN